MTTEKIAFLKKVTEFDKDGKKGFVGFVFGNGQVIDFDFSKVNEAMMYRLAVHGASQKIGDTASEFSKASDFGAAYAEMTDVVNTIYTGEWSRKRAGGAGRQDLEDLITALVTLKKQDEEVVRAAVEKASPETLKKWRANTTVAAEVADIKKKRAIAAKKTKVDTIDDVDLGI